MISKTRNLKQVANPKATIAKNTVVKYTVEYFKDIYFLQWLHQEEIFLYVFTDLALTCFVVGFLTCSMCAEKEGIVSQFALNSCWSLICSTLVQVRFLLVFSIWLAIPLLAHSAELESTAIMVWCRRTRGTVERQNNQPKDSG